MGTYCDRHESDAMWYSSIPFFFSLKRYFLSPDKEDKEQVVRQAQRIVTNMLFKMGCTGQTAHQLLFCADFLMGDTLKLLTYVPEKQDVEPGNICSLVALMYYVEP
jgi:hypothetical protein